MAGIFDKIEATIKNEFSKYFDALASNVSGGEIYKAMVVLDEKAHEVANAFGQGQEAIMGLKAAMGEAVTSVELLGGGFDDIARTQIAVGKELGRNVLLNAESYAKLYAAEKVSGQEVEKIVGAFKNAGISAYQAGKEMQTVIDSAREIGVNAKLVSSQVLANTELLNRYNFAGGVEGLSKMAAQAVSLRIDMKDIQNFASTVFNPEGAIEMAAAMQRLGVAQSDLLDPLRLMDLSANDPTELQNQIVQMTQQFVQLNKEGHFEIMPGAKRQFYEISKAMNIPYETLTKMAIGSEELDMKMKKISFPSNFKEEDKKMIANMAEMNSKGAFEVTFTDKKGNLYTKETTKLDDKDLEILREGSKSKTLEDLTKEQLDNIRNIAANMRAVAHQGGFGVAKSAPGQKIYGVQRDAAQAFSDTFVNDATSSKKIAQGINSSLGPVMETFKDMLAGKKSPQDALDKLTASFSSAAGYFTTFTTTTMAAGKAAGQKMLMSENEFTQMLAIVLKKLVATQAPTTSSATPTQNDFMINGQRLVTNPADTIFGGTGAEKFFESVNKLTSNNGSGIADNQSQNVSSSHDINFKLTVDSNQNIDMAQLERAFNSTGLKEKIIEVATLGMERFSPEASDRKKMNPYVKRVNA